MDLRSKEEVVSAVETIQEKIDAAEEDIVRVEENVRALNPGAAIVRATSPARSFKAFGECKKR